ncbi:hypothetical protein LINPERHAP2_LOCUS6175 [Linum perenne]
MTNIHGQVCDGRSGTMFCSSAIVAEAKAIKEAVTLASTRPVSTIILSDCLALIKIINDSLSPWPWECNALGTHIRQIMTRCPWISVDFTPRTSNAKAD